MKNDIENLVLHFRNPITLQNFVASLEYWLPELKKCNSRL